MLVAQNFTDHELQNRLLSSEWSDILIEEIAFWSELDVIIGLGETKSFSPMGGASDDFDDCQAFTLVFFSELFDCSEVSVCGGETVRVISAMSDMVQSF